MGVGCSCEDGCAGGTVDTSIAEVDDVMELGGGSVVAVNNSILHKMILLQGPPPPPKHSYYMC